MLLFSEIHASAVLLRAEAASGLYPGAAVQADFAGFSSVLDPNNLYSRPIGIPGAGRTGGSGIPDLVVRQGTLARVWEVKYGSALGPVAARYQQGRYLAGAPQAPGYSAYQSVTGAVFPQPQSLTTPSGFSMTVYSDGPGVELYSVDGGTQRIFAVLQAQLAQVCSNGVCATQQAEAAGDLREVAHADGSIEISLGNTVVATAVRTPAGTGVYVFPI